MVLRHVGADRAHPDQEPDAMSTATNIGGVTAQPVSRLIDEFSRLPGIGPKTASRLAYHILKTPKDDAIGLAEAILEVKERITLCSVCFNTTDIDPCAICANESREN